LGIPPLQQPSGLTMKRIFPLFVALLTATTVQSAPKKEDPWVTFTKWAYYRSAKQNNGKAVQSRSCQPELKVCTLAITFVDNKGSVTIARDTYDMNDKLIKRDICRFNDSFDIRTCTNWDTEEQTKEMKNSNNDWYIVSEAPNEQEKQLERKFENNNVTPRPNYSSEKPVITY